MHGQRMSQADLPRLARPSTWSYSCSLSRQRFQLRLFTILDVLSPAPNGTYDRPMEGTALPALVDLMTNCSRIDEQGDGWTNRLRDGQTDWMNGLECQSKAHIRLLNFCFQI